MARPIDMSITTKFAPKTEQKVPASTTTTPLSTTKKLVRELVIQPLLLNTHPVMVGDSTVSQASDIGIRLSGDASICMTAADLSQVYISCSDTTDGVNINYFE